MSAQFSDIVSFPSFGKPQPICISSSFVGHGINFFFKYDWILSVFALKVAGGFIRTKGTKIIANNTNLTIHNVIFIEKIFL